jgi:hypothetical protein
VPNIIWVVEDWKFQMKLPLTVEPCIKATPPVNEVFLTQIEKLKLLADPKVKLGLVLVRY